MMMNSLMNNKSRRMNQLDWDISGLPGSSRSSGFEKGTRKTLCLSSAVSGESRHLLRDLCGVSSGDGASKTSVSLFDGLLWIVAVGVLCARRVVAGLRGSSSKFSGAV